MDVPILHEKGSICYPFSSNFILERDTILILLNTEGTLYTCVSPGHLLSCSLAIMLCQPLIKAK